MKRLLALLGILLCIGVARGVEAVAPAAKPLVKIGVVTPMSSFVGTGPGDVLAQLILIIKRRAEELGTEPGNRCEYQFIFEDSKAEPKFTHMAAVKLLTVDHVDAIITVSAMSAKVVMPLAVRYKVPQLSLASENECDGIWSFAYDLDPKQEADLSMQAMQALGLKSYALVAQQQEGAVVCQKAWDEARVKYGMENKGTFWWMGSEFKNFRDHLLRAEDAKADLLVELFSPPEVDILLKQARQMGSFQGRITTLDSFDFVEDKSLVDGLWLAGCKTFTPEI
jgi:ABC-type branched-subunit amino acid transport system substrate-binding protein